MGKALLWAMPGIFTLLYLAVCNLDGNFWSNVPLLILYTVNNFSIGMMEEIIVRGLILGIMMYAWKNQPHGQMKAVLLSSFLFAIGHLGNLLTNEPSGVFTQITYAFIFGVFFAAIVLRGNNIWSAIALHSLIDFVSGIGELMTAQAGEAVSDADQAVSTFSLADIFFNIPVLITFVLFVYGVCILIFWKKSNQS